MSMPPWVKYKTSEGKKLCLRFLEYKLYNDSLDCDKIAADNNINCDNVYNLTESDCKKLLSGIQKNISKNTDDLEKNSQIKPKRGRPLKNGTIQRKKEVNYMLRQKNADSFLLLDDSRNTPDVLTDNDLYIENLTETVEIVKNNFFSDNPDLIKKHPSIWFRRLCLTIKQNSPKMIIDNNPGLISKSWDIYSELCLFVGINRTLENYQIFSGLHWATIDKLRKASSPDYVDLAKKIYDSCKADIVGGLGTSFGSSPNQMFIAKSIYGIVENTVITHVSAADNTKDIDDIPMFLEKKD